jgi:hypothetical protein
MLEKSLKAKENQGSTGFIKTRVCGITQVQKGPDQGAYMAQE